MYRSKQVITLNFARSFRRFVDVRSKSNGYACSVSVKAARDACHRNQMSPNILLVIAVPANRLRTTCSLRIAFLKRLHCIYLARNQNLFSYYRL